MKTQKLARFGYGYAAALLAAAVLGAGKLAWGFPALLILLVVGLCVKSLRASRSFWCVASAAVLAFGVFFFYTRTVYEPAAQLDGQTVSVKLAVEDFSPGNGFYSYELRLLEADGRPVEPVGVLHYSREDLGVTYGDIVETRMKLELNQPAEGRVLGDYYKSHGLFLRGNAASDAQVEVLPPEKFSLSASFHLLRDLLRASVEKNMPSDSAQIASGMLLGGSSSLDEMKRITFSRAGVSHLFSVSGLHMTIVVQLTMGLFALLRLNKRLSAGLGIFAVLGFMLLAGCRPSVLRAGIMMLILLAGQLFRRPANGLNSLGIACLFISLSNPYIMYDVGFLLSASATLGILLLARPMRDRVCKALKIWGSRGKSVVSLFTVSIAAVLGTLPVTLLCFQEVSLVGILLNPVINLFVSVAMFAGFATAFLGLVPFLSPLAALSGGACSWAVTVIDRGAEIAVGAPFAYLPLGKGIVQLWFVLSLAGFLYYRLFGRRKPKVLFYITAASFLVLVSLFAAERFLSDHSIAVTAVRSGEESGVLIEAGGLNFVYGCSNTSAATALRRELRARGVEKIDLYIQPDGNRRTGQITGTFSELFEIKHLALSGEALSTESYPHDVEQDRLFSMDGLELAYPDGTTIRIYGMKMPVVEVIYRGERYLAAQDLRDALPYLEEPARLVTAAESTTDRDVIPAEQILLLTPKEDTGDRSEQVIPGYESVRTTLFYPDWGGCYRTAE